MNSVKMVSYILPGHGLLSVFWWVICESNLKVPFMWIFWWKLDCFKYFGTLFACIENLEQMKVYFTVTFFSFFFAGSVFFHSLKSIAKSSKLLNIGKNWLKKGKCLQKSSAFDPETNNHRPLTISLVSKWKSSATNHLPQCEQCLKMSEE